MKKNTNPLFSGWKIFILIMLIISIFAVTSCGSKTIEWSEIVLSDMLPEPPTNKGEIHTNATDELWIYISNLSDKQFADYIKACKEKGFTIDAESSSSSFEAYNTEGYKLDLGHYGDKADMSIELDAPMEMNTITWPSSTAGEQLPKPKSTMGKFNYEHDDNFFVYIGNTSKADYAEYVNACSEKGFNVDYSKGDDYYYADNSEGWHVDIRYVGNNVISIDIDAPDDEDSTNDTSTSYTDFSTATPETAEKESEKDNGDNAIDPDFKTAMDSYEAFYDEYCSFMKEYNNNPTDLSLLTKYTSMIQKLTDMNETFESWKNENLNAAELKYYSEVNARVIKKIAEIAY